MSSGFDTPTVLISFPGEHEAAAVVAALNEQGLYATVTGSFSAGFRAEAPSVVNDVVKSSDLEAAQGVLDEYQLGDVEIDWSRVDVGEPEE